MNKLLQTESLCIATEEDLLNLKNKDHCRLLTVSDSHGGYRIFLKIILRYGPDCDALIFCGDGAGDIAEILEQAQVNPEIKNALPPVIAFVRGNGDPATYPVSFDIGKHNPKARDYYKGTLMVPEKQILTANNTSFFICHGHQQGVYYGMEQLAMTTMYNQCTVGLYGHTHVSKLEYHSSYSFINPGSISRPRGGDEAGFAIITVEKKFIDTAFIKLSSPYSDNPEFRVVK